MMTLAPDQLRLDRLLRRARSLCEAAAEMTADTSRAERLCLIADIESSLAALADERSDLRRRLARSQRTLAAATAYGRAQVLRPHR